jgi:hypothetical protein
MQATVTFPTFRAYNIEEIMVNTSQNFMIKLTEVGNITGGLKWFFDNDPALNIKVSEDGLQADIVSQSPGKATILIMDTKRNILKTLVITVVTAIPVEADILEVTSEILPK